MKARLAEIDAPERAQPFGQRARASLGALCFGRFATLKLAEKDSFGRSVARVECGGLDANAEQIRRGRRTPATRPMSP